MDGLAVDLTRRGFASWNIEFRRVGSGDGGWPNTLKDVAAAIDKLADIPDLDLSRIALIGHSAGAQLALWAASANNSLPVPGPIRVRPTLVVSLAGVTHLGESAQRGLGGEDVVSPFMGGPPEEHPDRYRATSPDGLVPIGVPQVIVQGRRDALVDLLDLNADYVSRAREAGDEVVFLDLPLADHFTVIDASSEDWRAVMERVQDLTEA
jgi:acetyl esterase/lipase